MRGDHRNSRTRLARPGSGRLLALVLEGTVLVLAGLPSRSAALTIDEAVARAAASNPTLRAARLEALAAQERVPQAYARHLGDADLVASASRYEGARLVRPITGPLSPATIGSLPFDRDQLHYGAAWQIPLFAGGALVGGDRVARLAETAARDAAAYAGDEVRYNVRAAYRNALALRHALAAAEAYEQALARDEASARMKEETEAWASADRDKVSYALAAARSRRAALAAQQRSALRLLGALMGADGSPRDAELEDVTSEPTPPTQPTAGLLERARSARLDLAAARATTEGQRRRVGIARSGYWPQLAFVGNYLFNDAPSVGRPIQSYELTLQLRIPLFADVGRVSAVREAEAAAAAAAERERAKAVEVESQVVDATGRVEAARAALEAGKAQRRLGAEVARVEALKLETGAGKVEDYLTARAQEVDGETGYWQGLYALQSAIDYLELVSGTGGVR